MVSAFSLVCSADQQGEFFVSEDIKSENIKTVFDLLKETKKKVDAINDYTCTFYKQEYVDGKILPREVIYMKFKKPLSVYMKWIGEAKSGLEVIFSRGWNDNNLMAHEGGWLMKNFVVNLTPTSRMAMKGNRHPVTETGFATIVNLIAKDMERIKAPSASEVRFVEKGMQTIYGVESYCFEFQLPKHKDPTFYAYKVLICINIKTYLPNRVQVWDMVDGKMVLVEDYGYANVKTNVGLTDRDFSPDNPEYEF